MLRVQTNEAFPERNDWRPGATATFLTGHTLLIAIPEKGLVRRDSNGRYTLLWEGDATAITASKGHIYLGTRAITPGDPLALYSSDDGATWTTELSLTNSMPYPTSCASLMLQTCSSPPHVESPSNGDQTEVVGSEGGCTSTDDSSNHSRGICRLLTLAALILTRPKLPFLDRAA